MTDMLSSQQQELIDTLEEMATAETNLARRDCLVQFPEGFGLVGALLKDVR
ncbi:hypothetical protein [Streptomyces sp. CB02009]|uniref:hypothetical protein n=1 Tax=Streptomyces sp. CB02009 TaxID=1703938 RepID=UPI0013017817|nr:hypothetical protein [Streptomyces sp. CB02009]